MADVHRQIFFFSSYSDHKAKVYESHTTYSALAAAFYPSLFTSLILVDPVIANPNDKHLHDFTSDLAVGALNRRDTWTSRCVLLAP